MAATVLMCAMHASAQEVVVVPLEGVATSSVAAVTWPAAVAPACRAFEAKCREKSATRGDLIALKRFIATSAIDPAEKTNVTGRVRKIYQESKKKKKSEVRG